MLKLRNDFVTGIAIILPIVVTITIVNFLVGIINRAFLSPIVKYFDFFLISTHAVVLGKITIFFLTLSIVVLIGAATRIIFLRNFFGFWEKIVLKVPMINKVYRATKQISKAFLGEGKTVFKQVALIEYPRKGLYTIVFITAEESSKQLEFMSKQ